MNIINKNLIVIAHSYKSFVKDSVDTTSKHFNQIDVCVRHNPFAEISNLLPINYLKPFTKENLIDLTNKPNNVNVIPTGVIYLPTKNGYFNLGEKHFKAVDAQIRRNNIKFDLIHSHFAWSSGYVGAKLKEKYKVPFIVTAHGYDIYDLPFRDDEWRERIEYVLNSADQIITVSTSNLKCINKLNVKTPVEVIPNGFDSNLFYSRDLKECRRALNLPLDRKVILSVGNLFEVKGHQYLIEAMQEVLKHKKDILCIIVGSGELKGKLEKQIKKLGLDSYIKLIGGRPHNEIPIWMNACDIFVLPSLRESFGIVQIEAMRCRKPVVATYNGGSEEIIISNEIGLLSETANAKDLAENILFALNKEWNIEMIMNYAEQFKWEIVIKKILDVYAKIHTN
ncbi:Trehalose synthase [uncultured archaeon]|nr:Trehalose synthase [uncultured archaeon]